MRNSKIKDCAWCNLNPFMYLFSGPDFDLPICSKCFDLKNEDNGVAIQMKQYARRFFKI